MKHPHKIQLIPILALMLSGCAVTDTDISQQYSKKYTSYLEWKETNEKYPDMNGDSEKYSDKNTSKKSKENDTKKTEKNSSNSNKSTNKDSSKNKDTNNSSSNSSKKNGTNKSSKADNSKKNSENSSTSKTGGYRVSIKSDTANAEGQIVYNVINSGARSVCVDVVAHFYDDKGLEIDTATDTIRSLDTGEDMIGYFDSEQVPEDFVTYKLKLSVSEVNSITSQKNYVLYSQSGDSNNVSISGRNDSGSAISALTFNVIYMEDQKVVACSKYEMSDLQAQTDFNEPVSSPVDSDGNNIEFNNYKVSLKDAFSYA